MTRLRRRLRLFAAAWLIFQATSWSALVPRACCLAHDAHLAGQAMAASSDEQAAGSHCARPSESATANAPHAAHHHTAPPTESRRHECAIRGTCGGPAAALFSVISTEGVLVSSVSAPADFPPAGAALVPHDQLIRQFEAPDSPPPRA
jgi:hypothetical protein